VLWCYCVSTVGSLDSKQRIENHVYIYAHVCMYIYVYIYIYVPMYIHTCIHILNYILIRQCGFHFYNEFSDCIKIEHKELVKTLKLKKQECVTFVVLFYFILLLLTLKFLFNFQDFGTTKLFFLNLSFTKQYLTSRRYLKI